LPSSRRSARSVTVVTLAPNGCLRASSVHLLALGLRVCLGHSTASYADTRAAMAEGLSGFTHLFNAMPGLGSRDPGPIAAALDSESAWFGMIVDGRACSSRNGSALRCAGLHGPCW